MRKKNKWRCKRQMKADIRWLDDPQVFRVNRLDAHSDHKFYENKEDYKKQDSAVKTIVKWNLEVPLFSECIGTSG